MKAVGATLFPFSGTAVTLGFDLQTFPVEQNQMKIYLKLAGGLLYLKALLQNELALTKI